MKYRYNSKLKRKSGIAIIESLVYVFLATIILAQGISLFTCLYKYYIEEEQLSVKYNKCQNYFINLDSVISEGGYEKIVAKDNNLVFLSTEKGIDPVKIIQSYDGKIAIRYMTLYGSGAVNVMIKDISCLELKEKGRLIYLIMKDKEGKEFIKCI